MRANTARERNAGKHNGVSGLTQQRTVLQVGLKPKDLIGVPWMVAFALRADGWWLRQEIIWAKPNPMPESTTDRCTKAHEHLFLLSKNERYFYDADAIAEPAVAAGDGRDETGFKSAADFDGKNRDGGVRGHRRVTAEVTAAAPDLPVPNAAARLATATSAATFHGKPRRATNGRSGRSPRRPSPKRTSPRSPLTSSEPCVKAGTSEVGCCPSCGTGWERITGKVETGDFHKMPDGMATYAGGHTTIHKDGREKGATGNPVTASVTLGFYPPCRCAGLPELPPYPEKPSRARAGDELAYKVGMDQWRAACRPVDEQRRRLCDAAKSFPRRRAVVLDPFAGAGTTGLVADRLGRDALLVELNPEYAAMIERRLRDDGGMFANLESA